MATDEKRAALHPDDQADDTPAQGQRPQPARGPGERQPDWRGEPPRAAGDGALADEELERLRQQILASVQPVLRDLQREIAESVRQQVQQVVGQPQQEAGQEPLAQGQRAQPPEGTQQDDQQERQPPEAASPLQQVGQAAVQSVEPVLGRLAKTLRPLLRAVRYAVRTVASLLRKLVVALQRSLRFATRPVIGLLSAIVRGVVQVVGRWVMQRLLGAALRALVAWLRSMLREEPGQETAQRPQGREGEQQPGQRAPAAAAA